MAEVTLLKKGTDNYSVKINGIEIGWYLRKRAGPKNRFVLFNSFNDGVLGSYETYVEAVKAILKFFK
jgi:hypothetical protein